MPANPVLEFRDLLDHEKLHVPPPGLFTVARWALIHYLRWRGARKIALPDYMCDEVVRALREHGFTISFYALGDHFEPNVDEIKRHIQDGADSIVVTHFYGRRARALQDIASLCRARGAGLIEDCVHWPYPFGCEDEPFVSDAKLYTLRKLYPVPGGATIVLREDQQGFAAHVAAAGPPRERCSRDLASWAFRQMAKRVLLATGLPYRAEYRDLSSDPLKDAVLACASALLPTRRAFRAAVARRRDNARRYAEDADAWGGWAEALPFDPARDAPYQFPLLLRPGLEPIALVRRLMADGLPAALGLALDPDVLRGLPAYHRYTRILALPTHQSLDAAAQLRLIAALAALGAAPEAVRG